MKNLWYSLAVYFEVKTKFVRFELISWQTNQCSNSLYLLLSKLGVSNSTNSLCQIWAVGLEDLDLAMAVG